MEILVNQEESRRGLSAALAQIEVFGSTESVDQANRLFVLVTNKPEKFPTVAEWATTWLTFRVQCRNDLGVKE